MTKSIFVAFLMMVTIVGSIQAQGLQRRRPLGGRSLQHQMDSAALLASATNEAEKAQIEQRIKNGELPEPLIPIEEALALAEKGDGKGYYQLAVRYAKGEGFEKHRSGLVWDTDDGVAVKFLKKAYDLKYPRAVYAVALGIESCLEKCADKLNLNVSDGQGITA